MRTLNDLPTPALIVDLEKLEANIAKMQERANALGVRLRPHVKTHKCLPVGELQRQAGARGVTVSTLREAEVFADAGFDDITWAFPVIPSRLPQIERLAERIRLGVVVDSAHAVSVLARSRLPYRVWIKVDCGYHRAGVDPASAAASELVTAIKVAGMEFAGLLSHSGDAYDDATESGRARVAERERATIVGLAARLRTEGHEVVEVSVGSTPAMTAVRDLTGVTEVRPGNYAYFDLTQVRLGSCELHDCAITVLATVVSSGSSHCVIDAGALALSKDPGIEPATLGEVFSDYSAARLAPGLRVATLSQEHGKLTAPLPVGDRVRVLPNHSCLTVACFTECFVVRGRTVVDRWDIANGR